MNPAFSPSSLKNLESSINRYLDIFIHGIEQRAIRDGGVVEMNKWFHNLSFDVVLDSKVLTGRLAVPWCWTRISEHSNQLKPIISSNPFIAC
jgi:hypothetical protein